MRNLIAAAMLLTSPVFAAPPQPGYLIQVAGMQAGTHSFGYKAYNGNFVVPAGELAGAFPFASSWQQQSAYHANTKVWRCGGFTGVGGVGKGLGDEVMELTVQPGFVRLERQTANGPVAIWEGQLGGNLTLQSQGTMCDASAATAKVTLVPDIAPFK